MTAWFVIAESVSCLVGCPWLCLRRSAHVALGHEVAEELLCCACCGGWGGVCQGGQHLGPEVDGKGSGATKLEVINPQPVP